MRSALFDLDTYSVIGRFAVDHTGMQVKRLEMILQWQDGRKEIVWPEEVRSAEPVFGMVLP
jgi:branched-chain amino acid transport system substrate-binding protein